MGDFIVEQRTVDGMFNATSLLKQWNGGNGMKKKLDHFFENESTRSFIEVLINEENLHARNSVYVKSRASRGKNAGTWMHPMLFIDFAMWINPKFKYHVIKFVHDKLIEYRHEAGDSYQKMCSSILKIVPEKLSKKAISEISRANNYVVFGNHEKMIRNKKGEEFLMKDLVSLQNKIAELIEDGFITNFDQLINYLRKKWRQNHTPKELL